MHRKENRVVVIGAGQIASGYDEPNSLQFLTHAHCLKESRNFILCGFYDIDLKHSIGASEKWGTNYFTTLEEAVSVAQPNMWVIATPTVFHLKLVQSLITFKPALILCEKPIASSYSGSLELVELCRNNGISLIINCQRSYHPLLLDLSEQYRNQQLGKFLTGTAIYSKGLIHSGSHIIDLIANFFDDIGISAFFDGSNDYSSDDLSHNVVLKCGDGYLHLASGNERSYSVWEMNLLFDKKRISLSDGGNVLQIFDIASDPIYKGHYTQRLVESCNRVMSVSLQSIYEFCDKVLSTKDYHENRTINAHLNFMKEVESRRLLGSIVS